ncbi:DUF1275 family protein [Ktedonobacteria bacterium brp13]|nr:DUF1275 family protein [Ktedonobacteria bacterium brp13]
MHDHATPPPAVEAIVERQQTWAAFLLAWVAGFSDAIGFLVLQQLGASFMSGNSMATGAALGEMDWRSGFRYGFAILSFILGIILGILVSAQIRQWGIRSSLAIISGLEALCLLAFLIIGSIAFQHGAIPPSPAGMFYLCIALLTVAMGLQTIVIQRVSGQGVHTTFVTGILNNWTQALIHYLFWLHMQATERHLRQAWRESRQQPAFRHLFLLGGIWIWYVVGAVCGSAFERRMALTALVFPIGVLAVLIAIDVFRPISV